MTEWRPIPSFPLYEASRTGRIRRIGKSNPLAICRTVAGYHSYRLARGGRFISVQGHSLTCEAFHGPKPSKRHETAHNDGHPEHGHADNLRWATRAENHADKRLHGTNCEGEAIPWAKLKAIDIPTIRTRLAAKESMLRIAADYGVSEGAINGIRIGRNWKHVGDAQ